jgi:acyl carrier protein
MDTQSVVEILKSYVGEQLLEGQNIGLEPTTPLLEWGVINSIEMARLVAFIRERFGVELPAETIIAPNFKDLTSIARLVVEQGAARP